MQTAAQTLKSATTFTGKSASMSDSTVATATSSASATAGSYDIAITTLAKAHSIRSTTNYAADATFEAGTLSIKIGSGTAKTITIDAGKTVAQIATAINDAKAGVSATVVDTGTLVLTSNTAGTAGAITFSPPATSTDDGNASTNPLTGLSTTTPVQTATDAVFSVNGIPMTRTSNTVTDAITGITLNLVKEGGSAKLTVANNTGAVTSAVGAFVKAYNDAMTGIKTLTAYDAANKKASVLTGDSTARSIQSQLSALIGTSVSGIAGGISRLSDIGISVQKDGTLAVDSSKLSAALADTNKDVSSLFTQTTSGNEGIAVRLNTMLEGIVGSSGLITSRTDGINASIKDLQKRSEALQNRLVQVERRYRAQFTALDSLVASMTRPALT